MRPAMGCPPRSPSQPTTRTPRLSDSSRLLLPPRSARPRPRLVRLLRLPRMHSLPRSARPRPSPARPRPARLCPSHPRPARLLRLPCLHLMPHRSLLWCVSRRATAPRSSRLSGGVYLCSRLLRRRRTRALISQRARRRRRIRSLIWRRARRRRRTRVDSWQRAQRRRLHQQHTQLACAPGGGGVTSTEARAPGGGGVTSTDTSRRRQGPRRTHRLTRATGEHYIERCGYDQGVVGAMDCADQ